MSKLTVEEVNFFKKTLEASIRDQVIEFEKKTGVHVSELTINRLDVEEMGNPTPYSFIDSVEAHIFL